jgi:hypothetical protein
MGANPTTPSQGPAGDTPAAGRPASWSPRRWGWLLTVGLALVLVAALMPGALADPDGGDGFSYSSDESFSGLGGEAPDTQTEEFQTELPPHQIAQLQEPQVPELPPYQITPPQERREPESPPQPADRQIAPLREPQVPELPPHQITPLPERQEPELPPHQITPLPERQEPELPPHQITPLPERQEPELPPHQITPPPDADDRVAQLAPGPDQERIKVELPPIEEQGEPERDPRSMPVGDPASRGPGPATVDPTVDPGAERYRYFSIKGYQFLWRSPKGEMVSDEEAAAAWDARNTLDETIQPLYQDAIDSWKQATVDHETVAGPAERPDILWAADRGKYGLEDLWRFAADVSSAVQLRFESQQALARVPEAARVAAAAVKEAASSVSEAAAGRMDEARTLSLSASHKFSQAAHLVMNAGKKTLSPELDSSAIDERLQRPGAPVLRLAFSGSMTAARNFIKQAARDPCLPRVRRGRKTPPLSVRPRPTTGSS